ncbi:MAG: GrpB family protein [Deltaproteobacteria bacterium]|nr:GrpB family protein [Deltaproteobacteria bacterium]
MLGLKKGTVQVVPYHPEWSTLFSHERCVLSHCLGNLVSDIQHVGSTAVPGLAAKPIIDIAVAVTSLAVIPLCRQPLGALGYIDRGDAGTEGGYLFVKESTPNVRTHHIHVVTQDDPQWNNYLRFRDLLRADDALRTTYAELKYALLIRFAQDRKAYTAAKEEFLHSVFRKMESESVISDAKEGAR